MYLRILDKRYEILLFRFFISCWQIWTNFSGFTLPSFVCLEGIFERFNWKLTRERIETLLFFYWIIFLLYFCDLLHCFFAYFFYSFCRIFFYLIIFGHLYFFFDIFIFSFLFGLMAFEKTITQLLCACILWIRTKIIISVVSLGNKLMINWLASVAAVANSTIATIIINDELSKS